MEKAMGASQHNTFARSHAMILLTPLTCCQCLSLPFYFHRRCFLCFYFLTCFVPLFSVNVRLTVYFPPPSHVGALSPVSLRRAFPTAQWSPGGSRPSSRTLTGTASCDRPRPTGLSTATPRRRKTTVMILSNPTRMMTAKRTMWERGC